MFRCVVIVALISLVSGFVHTNGLNRNNLIRKYASSDQQEVKDLNLEEMFDVFEAGMFYCSLASLVFTHLLLHQLLSFILII